MDKFDKDKVLQIVELSNELEFEKASALQLKLIWMIKDDESLKPLREHLRLLIRNYENKHWSNVDSITDEQITNNSKAELLVAAENEFIFERKN